MNAGVAPVPNNGTAVRFLGVDTTVAAPAQTAAVASGVAGTVVAPTVDAAASMKEARYERERAQHNRR